MQIVMQSVVSSNLSAVGYDEDEEILRVEFREGAAWEYNNVPPAIYRNLMDAPSVGNYFATKIKGKFGGKRV